jgi:hypothetical protein
MEVAEFFLERHGNLHRQMTKELLAGQSDDDLRARPHGVNSIAWLLWHVARCEDGAVSRWVAERPQLIDREPWLERMKMPLRHRGRDMTSAEVDDLSARIDLDGLRGYWDAVGASTREIVAELIPGRLDEIVTSEMRRRVLIDEGFANPAEKVPPSWPEEKRGYFLAFPGVTHGFGHFYEGYVTRSLVARAREAAAIRA